MEKQLTEEEIEARKAKIEAFLTAYKAVSEEHGLDFRCKLVFDPGGIVPRMEVFDLDKRE